MLAYMDWLMIPFAIFYLMLAALAVVVWVQLRRENMEVRALKSPSRRMARDRENGARSRHRARRSPAE